MRRFNVSGMSCASCSSRVEKAVKRLDGVNSCTVSLLTNSMTVEGSADDEAIIKAVKDIGYSASIENNEKGKGTKREDEGSEVHLMRMRLISSIIVTLLLMYFSMGALMWSFPLPQFFTKNHISIGIVEMFLSSIVLVINQRFFISGSRALWHRAPNMDTLVSMGSAVSYLWSLYLLLDASYNMAEGNMSGAMEEIHGLYFESSAMILALITVGKTLESVSKGKTTNAINSLLSLKSNDAVLLIDGMEVITAVEKVKIGDIFIVKSGEHIPVDGTVIEGISSVDESSLTGESIPVDKKETSKVYAGTINQGGYLMCRAEKVGEDTTLSKIIALVEETASSKAPISRIADKVSGIFVPVVMTIALITTFVWLIVTHGDISLSLERGISVLVISCPCALGLATPVAIMVSSGVGAKNGILFKSASSIEELGSVSVVALDKTGTITENKMRVSSIHALNGDEDELIKIASSIEKVSTHPIAKAVVSYAGEKKIEMCDVKESIVIPGKGIKGYIDSSFVYCGNAEGVKDCGITNTEYLDKLENEVNERAASVVYVVYKDKLIGLIEVSDTIRKDSRDAVKLMKKLGLKVCVITGDNKKTAEAVCSTLDSDMIISSVLPGEKAQKVKELKKYGKVCFIGDGINDSPALTEADVGLSIGGGTDIAIDSSSVVLMKSTLMDAVAAINLSRHTLRNIYENLFWAFIYNIIGIPLAAGVFIPLLGWRLSPMFGAAAMSLSSFCVVSNALRINLCNIYKVKSVKKYKEKEVKEKKEMEKTIKVDGMMCSHCEKRVEDALSKIEGVVSVKADHEKKEVHVTLDNDVDESVLEKAVEKEGYTIIK